MVEAKHHYKPQWFSRSGKLAFHVLYNGHGDFHLLEVRPPMSNDSQYVLVDAGWPLNISESGEWPFREMKDKNKAGYSYYKVHIDVIQHWYFRTFLNGWPMAEFIEYGTTNTVKSLPKMLKIGRGCMNQPIFRKQIFLTISFSLPIPRMTFMVLCKITGRCPISLPLICKGFLSPIKSS